MYILLNFNDQYPCNLSWSLWYVKWELLININCPDPRYRMNVCTLYSRFILCARFLNTKRTKLLCVSLVILTNWKHKIYNRYQENTNIFPSHFVKVVFYCGVWPIKSLKSSMNLKIWLNCHLKSDKLSANDMKGLVLLQKVLVNEEAH